MPRYLDEGRTLISGDWEPILWWKLYVEHMASPPVQFYETTLYSDMESALNRAFAIYRNPGWRLKVLFIEAVNGMRIETAEITALAAAGILGRVRRVAGCRGCDQPRDLRVL
jgi:hypothetical protein